MNNLTSKTLPLVAILIGALSLDAKPTEAAMRLSQDGTGQVLIFPYYTVNNGNDTLISLTNTTDQVKAVSAKFFESRNGRVALDFYIYLAPNDTWTAALTANNEDDPASILVSDQTCTVPDIVGQDDSAQEFLLFEFTGQNTDGGGDTAERTREGYFEFIELGEVALDGLGANAVPDTNGLPSNCGALVAAHFTGGAWLNNPQLDLSAPTGGLSAAASVINPEQGYQLSIEPTVIEDFYRPSPSAPVSLHASLDELDAAPTLNSGGNGIVDGPVSIQYMADDGSISIARFSRAADAVSALLMSESIQNDFAIDPDLNGATDWVTTFPTRSFYVSETVATAPFTSAWSGESSPDAGDAISPEIFDVERFDREGVDTFPSSCCVAIDPPPPPAPPPSFDYAANVLSLADRILSAVESTTLNPDQEIENGTMRLQFADRTLTSLDGVVFSGLPLIGFAAQVYRNGNVPTTQGAVLANYGGTTTHDRAPGVSTTASGMRLDPRAGQVLIFPWYSADAGNDTLISLANNTDQVKAVRANFRESRNGREVLSFNLYLGPRETWVGAVTLSFGAASATLLSIDETCTIPAFVADGSSPGFPQLPMRNDAFSGDNADGAGESLNRARQGYFEFIEMGTVNYDLEDGVVGDELGDYAAQYNPQSAPGRDCLPLSLAWSDPDGRWQLDPQHDMGPPTGGLSAFASIINVTRGYLVSTSPTVLDGFYQPAVGASPSLHRNGEALTLNDGGTGIDGEPTAIELINSAGNEVTASFDRPVDAVSALLMSANLSGEFALDQALAAKTDWVMTFPTRSFYVESDPVRAPFLSGWTGESTPGASDAVSAEPIALSIEDRAGQPALEDGSGLICFPGLSCTAAPSTVDYAANILTFDNTLNPPERSSIFGSQDFLIVYSNEDVENGQAAVQLENYPRLGALFRRPPLVSREGIDFAGLPAVGFAATIIENNTLSGSAVLTNYGSARSLGRQSQQNMP